MSMLANTDQKRGRLKVYLGYAVGVGKTYAMLVEAHRLQQEGIDIVVGYVEPHGRKETEEKLSGLEIIPPCTISYRGITLRETNVPEILKRLPSVVLIDEIAHSNAVGSTFQKRYEDIAALLAAGIDVTTTLNIQHLESLAPVIENNLGVRIPERIPNHIIIAADSIMHIDLPVRKLIRRAKEGKIYKPEMIETALLNFFTKPNLKFLRKLAREWLKGKNTIAG